MSPHRSTTMGLRSGSTLLVSTPRLPVLRVAGRLAAYAPRPDARATPGRTTGLLAAPNPPRSIYTGRAARRLVQVEADARCSAGASTAIAAEGAAPLAYSWISATKTTPMNAVLDFPVPKSYVDPRGFSVRGWVWLGDGQHDLEAVEAFSADGALLGRTETLAVRQDVNAALGAPAETRTGFEFLARFSHVVAGPLELRARLRFRNGHTQEFAMVSMDSLVAEGSVESLDSNPVASTNEARVPRWIGKGKIGVEIGALTNPVPGLSPPPFYVDRFAEFSTEKVHAQYYGDACSLPFRDNSLDYVVCSNVLEHVANPVAALAEWQRVLRPWGIIYLVVPDRRYTWDHPRCPTPIEHFLEDYERGTTDCDPTHIDDFIDGIDWSMSHGQLSPAELTTKKEEVRASLRAAVAAGLEINLHFHVFEPQVILGLLEKLRTWPNTRFNWEIVDFAERFPTTFLSGILVVLRVKKTWSDRLPSLLHRACTLANPQHPLRADAKPLASDSLIPKARDGEPSQPKRTAGVGP